MNAARSLLVVLFALVVLALAGAPSAAAAEDEGLALIKELGCNKCHAMAKFEIEATIKSEAMKGADLSEIGAQHDAEWIKKWLLKEVELEGKAHRSKWSGTEKQLETLTTWLATLKP